MERKLIIGKLGATVEVEEADDDETPLVEESDAEMIDDQPANEKPFVAVSVNGEHYRSNVNTSGEEVEKNDEKEQKEGKDEIIRNIEIIHAEPNN